MERRVAAVLGIDVLYRTTLMMGTAIDEAREKDSQ
jgi:hypothetical protein